MVRGVAFTLPTRGTLTRTQYWLSVTRICLFLLRLELIWHGCCGFCGRIRWLETPARNAGLTRHGLRSSIRLRFYAAHGAGP
jgi:hypothetical protein